MIHISFPKKNTSLHLSNKDFYKIRTIFKATFLNVGVGTSIQIDLFSAIENFDFDF